MTPTTAVRAIIPAFKSSLIRGAMTVSGGVSVHSYRHPARSSPQFLQTDVFGIELAADVASTKIRCDLARCGTTGKDIEDRMARF